MNETVLLKKISANEPLSDEEAMRLPVLPLSLLMLAADIVRKRKHPDGVVTYIIDRNINITNVCFSFCDFCSFCCSRSDKNAYILKQEDYIPKIEELFAAGGNQVLLQGGMHPDLGLDFYINLFQYLKQHFEGIYLHALSPSEIFYLSQKENLPVVNILQALQEAGLDSLPGGGAEILVDRVRSIVSPLKANSQQWLEVMRHAHILGISTTATMMFGHIETSEERIVHLLKIRKLQDENKGDGPGFVSFIPWTFQPGNTRLLQKFPSAYKTTAHEYLKIIAMSRIILHNISNIQASWLTVGKHTASVALHSGSNDLGSIMLEENVVASTGLKAKLSIEEMESIIIQSGFLPAQRNQKFEKRI